MKNRNLDAERFADELLMAWGKELGEARASFCEALMDPNQPDPPMFIDETKRGFVQKGKTSAWDDWDDDWEEESYDDADDSGDDWDLPPAAKGLELLEGDRVSDIPRHHGSRRVLRRVLILAATLILMLGLVMVAAEGVKLKKSSLHMEEYTGESTRIIDISKAELDVEDFNVTYVPEGYELVEDVLIGEYARMIKYQDKNDDVIKIHISKTDKFGTNVDNETTGRIEVLVNDKQAHLFDDGKTSFIVWQIGDCTLDITADISEEELVKIANHIFVN